MLAVVACAAAFTTHGGTSACNTHSALRSAQLRTSVPVAAAAACSEEVLEQLWASARSPLLRIGKAGAAQSHANGLLDLCSSHPAVSVRLTGASTQASLDGLLEMLDVLDESQRLTLLATRKPRKGGVEALFSQAGRSEELCSVEYHAAQAAAAAQVAETEAADAITYRDAREARAVRQAARLDKAGSKRGLPRYHRRAGKPAMMASLYKSVGELEAAIQAYIAELPEGAVDDPTLPSPLNYNELNYNGRSDLVEGCMAYGGYLKLSNELGIPVRIGVERPPDAQGKSGATNAVAKGAVNLFNMFGKAG
jgi:hypothetical protein